VFPGSKVMVQVEVPDGFQPAVVFVTGGGQAVFLEAPPFLAEFPIPAQALGTIELVAFGLDEQGEMLESNSVVLPVVSPATLISMEVLNGDAVLRGPGSTRQLVVLGNYNDGLVRDISASSLGTVYSSSNTNIATVTSGGKVTGKSPGRATITMRNGTVFTSITVTVGDNNSSGQCLQVRLGDHNLLVLEDYSQGHYIGGRVAAGGNISLQDFAVGNGLSDTDTTNVLVAGGDITLSRGGLWGDIWHGGQLVSDTSVSHVRGTASQGTPIDFAALGGTLRALSSSLSALPATGTTTLEPSWGGILLRGTEAKVNVFEVNASAFQGATLFSIDAPAGSLAVINVRGTSATLSSFGQSMSGGIDEHGVLFNFPEATSLTASGYGFQGTMLAPLAHVTFNDGSWSGGLYARSLTGNASGYINRLRDMDICL
jgi:choice-of-anchor A domain-containing protein